MNTTMDDIPSETSAARSRPAAPPFLVAQLGARMHYAIPRMLEAEGALARLCTDICAVKGWPRLLRAVPHCFRPAGLRRLLGRLPVGVPAGKIRAYTAFGWAYGRRRAAARNPGEQADAYLWAGERLCELILREGLDGIGGVYTFNSAGLELLRAARQRGIRAVMEQTIAPGRIQETILAQEHECFAGWEPARAGSASIERICAREEAEWHAADVVLCGSTFVKESIAACGGPAQRCVVVPYGVDQHFRVGPRSRGDKLRVLTVGTVDLRKGAPYVLQTAQRLRGQAVFRMVGPIALSPSAICEMQASVELIGPVPRPEIVRQYEWADVFLLPSLCEGSATVTYEALACGLPVVCTPNTGSVVRDGVDGFVVQPRDVDAMSERLRRFHEDRDFLEFASQQARRRSSEFTLEAYRMRLMNALQSSGLNQGSGGNSFPGSAAPASV